MNDSQRVAHIAACELPSVYGRFTLHAYRDLVTGAEHVAIAAPTPDGGTPWARIHSECLTGEALGSLRCDCGPQLASSLRAIAEHGGAVVHLAGHEGRGIGIAAKVAAYALQDAGRDTIQANLEQGLPVDSREYGAAAAILRSLGLKSVRLLTNNPDKVAGLTAAGIKIVSREPLAVGRTSENERYLETKRAQMGHVYERDTTEGPLE